ncbi:hypothetical protein [Mycobacterium sp. OTB74]|nr:hypothetical protein [Mycobacterium sp. OTB74]MDH6247569.1 hypothetical protein [Mycobacterium sp. OTB74]
MTGEQVISAPGAQQLVIASDPGVATVTVTVSGTPSTAAVSEQ